MYYVGTETEPRRKNGLTPFLIVCMVNTLMPRGVEIYDVQHCTSTVNCIHD